MSRKTGLMLNKIIGETAIHVWRDRVWIKPYHLTIKSGNGTAHWMFWRLKSALKAAEWIALVVGDAVEAEGEVR